MDYSARRGRRGEIRFSLADAWFCFSRIFHWHALLAAFFRLWLLDGAGLDAASAACF
jgi:hypothetical protein